MVRLTATVTAVIACLLINDASAQGPRGGPPGLRAGGGPSMSMRGPSMMRSPSISARLPSAAMRGGPSILRSPSSMMRGPSISLRGPLPARAYSGSSYASRSGLYYSRGLSLGPRLPYVRPLPLGTISRPYSAIRPYPSPLYYSRVPTYSRYGYRPSLYDTYDYGYSYGPSPAVTLRYTQPYAAAIPVAPIVRPNPYSRDDYMSDAYQSAMPENRSQGTASNIETGPQRLTRSLATRDQDDVWMNFLKPHQVTELIRNRDAAGMADLLQHYEGVAANPELAWVVNLDGFSATRELLRNNASTIRERAAEQDSVPLPVPDPEPVESLPTPAEPIKDAALIEL